MNWNDYEAIWKRQQLPAGAGADLATLQATFETKRRKLAATLWVRDLAEASAGVVVTAAFALMWWKQGRSGWPIGIAMALILCLTGFFIKERIRAHRQRAGIGAPLLEKLEAEIAELRHQRRLLLHVAAWYLAPCLAAVLIVLATLLVNAPTWAWRVHLLFLGGYLPMLGFLYWLVWWLNRRAVRKQIDPRLQELEKLQQSLSSP